MIPSFAIIDRNTLESTALKRLLLDIYYGVEVLCYNKIEAFIRDSNRHFLHFFVSSDILFGEIEEFETLKQQTTVISTGPGTQYHNAGFHVLDLSMEENAIKGQLRHLQIISSYSGSTAGVRMWRNGRRALSKREKEVLSLMVKGLINKEISEELNISLPTVIFHRNNICKKMQTRSIGKLTVFAVLSGIVDINEI